MAPKSASNERPALDNKTSLPARPRVNKAEESGSSVSDPLITVTNKKSYKSEQKKTFVPSIPKPGGSSSKVGSTETKPTSSIAVKSNTTKKRIEIGDSSTTTNRARSRSPSLPLGKGKTRSTTVESYPQSINEALAGIKGDRTNTTGRKSPDSGSGDDILNGLSKS